MQGWLLICAVQTFHCCGSDTTVEGARTAQCIRAARLLRLRPRGRSMLRERMRRSGGEGRRRGVDPRLRGGVDRRRRGGVEPRRLSGERADMRLLRRSARARSPLSSLLRGRQALRSQNAEVQDTDYSEVEMQLAQPLARVRLAVLRTGTGLGIRELQRRRAI